MGIVVISCPHCTTDRISMHVLAHWTQPNDMYEGFGAARCPNCNRPVGLHLRSNSKAISQIPGIDGNIAQHGFTIKEIYPAPPSVAAPEFCPDSVQRVYLQAVSALHRSQYDAAGAMFRKTLEVALKAKDQNTKGMLAQRIKALADKGILTADLAVWANEIKEIGNPTVHDEEEPDAEDIIKLGGLTEMVLRYIYTLPGMVAARRMAADEVEA